MPSHTVQRPFSSLKNSCPWSENPVWWVLIARSKACFPQGQGHTGFPSSGLPGSVFLWGELGSFIMNLSVGSHGATVRSVAPHRDLQSLRQFLGCQLGLQLLKLNTTQEKKLTWIGCQTENNHIIIKQHSHSCWTLNKKRTDNKLNSPL